MWKALPAVLLLAASAWADPTTQVRVETLLGDVSGKAAALYAAAEGEAAGAEYKAKEKERLAFDERLRLAEADLGTLITRTRTSPSQAGLPRFLEKSRAELRFWRELSAHDVRLARWQSLAAPPRDEALRGCDAAAAFVQAAVAEDSAPPVDPRRNGTLETLAVRVSMRVADLRARLAVEAGPRAAVEPVRVPGRPAVPEAPAAGENSEAAYRALFDGETSRRASEPDDLSRLGDLPVDGEALPPALGRGPMLVSGARLKIQEAFLKADAGALDSIDRLADDAMRELRVEEGESRRGRRATSESREWFERAHEELRLLARNAREAKDASTLQEKEALLASLYRRLDQIYADGDRSLKPPESEYRAAMAKYLQSGGGRPGLEAQDAVTRLEAALAAYRSNPRDAAAAARLRDIFAKSGDALAAWERDDPQALYEFLFKMHGARELLTRDAGQADWAPVIDIFDAKLAGFVGGKAREPGRPQASGAPERALTMAFAESLSFFPLTSAVARRAAAGERLDAASGETAAAADPVLALVPAASRAALERDRAEALAIKDSALRAERVGAVVDRALEAARANPELAPALDAPRLALEARRAYEAKVEDASKTLSESADARDGLARLAQAPPGGRAAAMEELRASLGERDAAALETVLAASRGLREELAGIELREAAVHAAHPELGALMDAALRADAASLEFVRSGDAPDGTVATIDGPSGRVEARAGPWAFGPRDELGWPDAPFPLDEYLQSVHGRVSGWHQLSPGRREFRSHDGRLRIVVEESADGETQRFQLDGRFAGSLVKKTGKDPKLESSDPDHPHVVLLGRGDRSREPHAWVDLSHLETATDAGDRRAAISELARELSSFLGSNDAAAMESFLLHQLTEPRGKPSLVVQRQRNRGGAEIDLRFEEPGGHMRLLAMWHEAKSPERIEGTLTLAGPGGRDARRTAQLAYQRGIYERTMDANYEESNPISLQMGTRAMTERFKLDGGRETGPSGPPMIGPFKPHTDVNRLWVDVAGAGLETVGTIMQELGAQVRYVAVDPLAAVVVGVTGDGWTGFNRVMLDSESNHNNTPLNRWLQKQTGLNYAADQWSMMSKAQRDIYADRAARKGLTGPHAAYLEYRNAGTPAEQNMALARQAQARANATGSKWDQAAAFAFTGVAVGAQVGESFLGSFAAGGMVQGVGKLLPTFGRVLGIGMEGADLADTAQGLAQLPAHVLALNLKNPDSVAALTMALVDLEGVGDVMGHARNAVDPGRVRSPAAPGRPDAADGVSAAPEIAPSPAPASPDLRERSPAPVRDGASPDAPRGRLSLDPDPMHANVVTGTFDGVPVVVKLNATATEMANQQRARTELAAMGADNVHVPLVLRGGPTDLFLDKAIAAAPDDGGAFAKIGGETLGDYTDAETVISERLPDDAVSLRDVLSGKAKIEAVDAADLQGLQNAIRGLHKAGMTNALEPGNIFLRQVNGRTHFHLLGWGGGRGGKPMGDAFNAVWDGLAGMDLAVERAKMRGGEAPVKRGSRIPADPDRAREIRGAHSRRPSIKELVKRYLRGSDQRGFAKDEKTPTQGAQGDCATRSLYNHPLSEGIRQAMSYRTFHDLVAAVAKKKLGIETIDDGLFPEEQEKIAAEFGFLVSEATDVQSGADLARRLEFENMGVRASIAWRDAGETGAGGRHAVVVEGAFKEDGEWKFVVRDPHKPTPYLFSWADLKILGVTVFDMMPSLERMARGPAARGPDGTRARAMELLGEFDVVATPEKWGSRYKNPELARRAAARERELYGKIVALATELGVPANPNDAGAIFRAVQTTAERTNWGRQVWGQDPLEAGPAEMMKGIRDGKYDAAYFARLNLDGPKARLLEAVYARESLMSPTAALGGKDPNVGNRSAPARSRLMGEIAKLFEEQDAAGGARTGAEIPIPTAAELAAAEAAARPVPAGAEGGRNRYAGVKALTQPMNRRGQLTGQPARQVYTREITVKDPKTGKSEKVKETISLDEKVAMQPAAEQAAYRAQQLAKELDLERQNRAADALVRHGFDVDRLGGADQAVFDYMIRDARGERVGFDCRASVSDNLDHIRQGIVNKNADGKSRQVVTLAGVTFTPAQVAAELRRRPVGGLIEILFVDQRGGVHQFNPANGDLKALRPF